jgi:phosphoenolpyruvate-protein kinase (PTS system EI component)
MLAQQPSIEAGLPQARTATADEEAARLRGSLERAEEELWELARAVEATAGADEAGIFEAQAEFAADPELARMAEEAIRTGASAERAVVPPRTTNT